MIEYITYLGEMGNFTVKFYTAEDLSSPSSEPLTYNSKWSVISEAISVGKLDMLARSVTARKVSNFSYIQPEIYGVFKPIFTVDRALDEKESALDGAKIFKVFELDIWMALICAVGAYMVLSLSKSWLERLPFWESFANEFERISGYVTLQGATVKFRENETFVRMMSTTFGLGLGILALLFGNFLLTSMAVDPGYNAPFNTLREMRRAGYKFFSDRPSLLDIEMKNFAKWNQVPVNEISQFVTLSEYSKSRTDLDFLRHKYIIQEWQIQTRKCDFRLASVLLRTEFGSLKKYPQEFIHNYYLPVAKRKPELVKLFNRVNEKAQQFGMHLPVQTRRDQVYSPRNFILRLSENSCKNKLKRRVRALAYDSTGLQLRDMASLFLAWLFGIFSASLAGILEKLNGRRSGVCVKKRDVKADVEIVLRTVLIYADDFGKDETVKIGRLLGELHNSLS